MGRAVGALAVVVVAVFALAEAGPHLAERFVGIGAVDDFGTLWFHAQVRAALGGDPGRLLHTPVLYFPWGQDLLRNTGANVVDGLLAAPFVALAGPVLGHNLFRLAVLVANGVAGAVYARRHAADAHAAWMAGLALAVAPYPLYELVEGRPAQALLVAFVGFLGAFERALAGEARPWPAGVWLAVLGYQYWFYALFAGAMAIVGAAVAATRPAPGRSAGDVLRAVAIVGGVAAGLAAPLAGPLLMAMARGEVPGLLDPHAPAGLLLHSFQPLHGVTGSLDGATFVATQRAFPLALLLAAVGLRTGRGGRAVPLGMAAVALFLAVGPVLVVGSRAVAEPLYVLLADTLPPLRRLWHPSRALAGLVVLGVGWLARLPLLPRAALLVLGIGEAARDGLLPLPTWGATVPAAWRCLAAPAPEGALIEVPFGVSQRHLWYQSAHGRPLLGGMHEGAPAFQPPEAVALRSEDPWLATLLDRSRGARSGAAPPPSDAVHALGFRWVVLERDELPAGDGGAERTRRRRVEDGVRELLGAPVWDDARATVWAPWGDPLPCAGAPPAPDTVPGEPAHDRRVRDLGTWTLAP